MSSSHSLPPHKAHPRQNTTAVSGSSLVARTFQRPSDRSSPAATSSRHLDSAHLPSRSTSSRSTEHSTDVASTMLRQSTLRSASARQTSASPQAMLGESLSSSRSHPSGADSASDTLAALDRQIRHVQQSLQSLLDAQSAGLLAGLGRSISPDAVSPSSSRHIRAQSGATRRYKTATSEVIPAPNVVRRSLGSQLTDLAQLHAAQAAALQSQTIPFETFMQSIEALTSRQRRLMDAIANLEQQDQVSPSQETDPTALPASTSAHEPEFHGPPGSKSSLPEEESQLEAEIKDTKVHLASLKNKLRRVRLLQKERTSTREAQLSSWRSALSDVERTINGEILSGRSLETAGGDEARRYLRHARLQSKRGTGRSSKSTTTLQSPSVWSLALSRRNVGLVTEDMANQLSRLRRRQATALEEEKACAEGSRLWTRVVRQVTAVERRLRKEMRILDGEDAETRSSSAASFSDSPSSPLSPISRTNSIPLQRQSTSGSTPGAPRAVKPSEALIDTGTARGVSSEASPPPTSGSIATNAGTATAMASADGRRSDSVSTVSTTRTLDPAERGIHEILRAMDEALSVLSSALSTSEENKWTLLVCAIGAEAAAMDEARTMLSALASEPEASRLPSSERPADVDHDDQAPFGLAGSITPTNPSSALVAAVSSSSSSKIAQSGKSPENTRDTSSTTISKAASVEPSTTTSSSFLGRPNEHVPRREQNPLGPATTLKDTSSTSQDADQNENEDEDEEEPGPELLFSPSSGSV